MPFIVSLDVVPADLVGIQVQFEGAVVSIDGGILRNIGVVDHAVLAVGNECVNFNKVPVLPNIEENTDTDNTEIKLRTKVPPGSLRARGILFYS